MDFSNTDYLKALMEFWPDQETITCWIQNDPYKFSYKQVTYEDFSEHYTDKGIVARKFLAIPQALFCATIKVIYHFAIGIILGIPKAIFSNPLYIRSKLSCIPRDYQEALGWLITLFHDRLGSYIQQGAQFHKECYVVAHKYPQSSPLAPANNLPKSKPDIRLKPKPYNFPKPKLDPYDNPDFFGFNGYTGVHFKPRFSFRPKPAPGYSYSWGFTPNVGDPFFFGADFRKKPAPDIRRPDQSANESSRIQPKPKEPKVKWLEVLGLGATATLSEAKKAYFKLIMEHHTDKVKQEPGESKKDFDDRYAKALTRTQEINQAYGELKKIPGFK